MTKRRQKYPSIPFAPVNVDPTLRQFLDAVKTQLEYIQENPALTEGVVNEQQLNDAVQQAVSGIIKGQPGQPGSPGSPGAPGQTFVLDIVGGRTNIVYDANGLNPIPVMTPFSAELYVDGVLVTPSDFSWHIPNSVTSLLSGTSNSATFTPTVAATFAANKPDNTVALTVSYSGKSISANEPIVISKLAKDGADGSIGPQGPQGDTGSPGPSGSNGQTSYFHVAYANSADGTVNFNQVHGEYIGTYVDFNPIDSTNPANYNWVLIRGAQGDNGAQGIPGVNGENGITSYLHIKYSNDGGATLTGNNGEDVGLYIGTYVDNTPIDSIDPLAYTWARLRGEDGASGRTALLFITGGKTNAVYGIDGQNPLPLPSAFSAELYVDGTIVTPDTFEWSVPATGTMLVGSSTTSTFTPSYAGTFDIDKGDNRVLLTVTFDGLTAKAVQPVIITRLYATPTDDTPPQAIIDLAVFGGVLHNFLTWGPLPGNTDHIQIWRAAIDDRNGAVIVGTTQNRIFKDFIPEGINAEYFYWIRAISKSGVEGEWNLVFINNAWVVSAQGTSATATGINSQHVESLVAEKIIADNLSAISANLGNISAGSLHSGDNRFQIDLNNKSIIIGDSIADPSNNWQGGNYTIIQDGDVTSFIWDGAQHIQSKSLRTIETGIAANNEIVYLNLYYPFQPQIFITPRALQVYSAENPGQSQTLNIEAKDISNYAPGKYQFKAVAELTLSNNSQTVSINNTISGASDTQTSAVYVSPGNCINISVSVNLLSREGHSNAGTSLIYRHRRVTLELQARLNGTPNAFVTIQTLSNQAIGGTITAPITLTISGNTASQGVWDYRVVATYSRVGTTFTVPGGGYETGMPGQATLPADTANFYAEGTPGPRVVVPCVIPFPASPPNPNPGSGWSITSVAYNIYYDYIFRIPTSSQYNYCGVWPGHIADDFIGAFSSHTAIHFTPTPINRLYKDVLRSYTSTSYDRTIFKISAREHSEVWLKYKAGSSVTVNWRRLQSFDTSVTNTLTMNSATFTLGSAVTLAQGTLNYQAIL